MAALYRCIFFFLLIPFFVYPQNKKDSLSKLLATASSDTAKIDIYIQLSHEIYRNDTSAANNYLEKALVLAQKLNYKNGITNIWLNKGLILLYTSDFNGANSYFIKAKEAAEKSGNSDLLYSVYSNLAILEYSRGNYDEALTAFLSCYEVGKKKNNKSMMASACNNIGLTYWNKGDLAEALDYSFKALKIREEQKDFASFSASYGNIGLIYYDQGLYEKSKDYQRKSMQYALQNNNKFNLANACNNLGIVFEKLSQLDSAEFYQLKGLSIRKEVGDVEGISTSYNNLGNIYRQQKQYNKALKAIEEALKMSLRRDDKGAAAVDYINYADIFNMLKKYDKAFLYYDSALVIAEAIGAKNTTKTAYRNMAETTFNLGKFSESNTYWKKYDAIKDSIFNEDNQKAIAEMNGKYETEKKEKEIESLKHKTEMSELEANRGRVIIYSIAGIVALLLLMIFLIYNRYRVKRKANIDLERKNTEIETKNKEIHDAYSIIEEKNKDITDSINYAKRIQQSVLPSPETLNEMLEDHFVVYKPKDVVSGDFYWAVSLRSTPKSGDSRKLVIISVIDCTGHGVPGAFMSLIGKTLLSQTIKNPDINSPGDVLDYLDTELPKVLNAGNRKEVLRDGMDMSVCALDLDNLTIHYAGANNPVYIINDGVFTELKPDKQAIGGLGAGEKPPFTNHTLNLSKGACLYLFSDGYVDQFGGPKGKKFKSKQLQELLLKNHKLPMKEQGDIIQKTFDEWKGGLQQIDDVTIIGVKL